MTLRLILELEDNELHCLLARRRGKRLRIEKHDRISFRELKNLEAELRGFLGEVHGAKPEVYVLVSDRRIVHGTVQRPRAPKRHELTELLNDESRRIGMYADDEDLCVGYRASNGSDGWKLSFVVAPKSALAPILEILGKVGLDRVRVTSTEAVLAGELSGEQEKDAVCILDLREGIARLILAVDGDVCTTRKIKAQGVSGEGEVDPTAFLPLGVEVQRSIEYFERHGAPHPGSVLLTGEVYGLLKETSLLKEAMGFECRGASHVVEDACEGVSLDFHHFAPMLMLAYGGRRSRVPFLLESGEGPTKAVRNLVLQGGGIAAMAAGLFFAWSGLEGEGGGSLAEGRRLEERISALRGHLRILEEERKVPDIVEDRRVLLGYLLKDRIPVSRIFAVLANERPEEIKLTALTWDRGELRVRGVIDSPGELAAVKAFSLLDEVLTNLPLTEHGGGSLRAGKDGKRGVPFEYKLRFRGGGK